MAKTKDAKDTIKEMKVIQELQKNSKVSIEAMAKICGVSRQKVYRIIKHLEGNQIIWGYSAIVNESQLGLQKFLLLLKRSNQPLEKGITDKITSNGLEPILSNLGISVESSYYLHGEYDWELVFTAKDLRHAIKFSNLLVQNYPGLIKKMNLIQILFANREHNVFNPNRKKLKDFV
jgi:DNA-binding Lrp family transcriptional regulator